MTDRPEVHSIVRHFKKVLFDAPSRMFLYEVVAYAVNATNDKECVIYRSLDDDTKIYTRDLDDFNGLVDKQKYPNSEQEYKFVVVGMFHTDNVTGERYIKYY